MTERGIKNMKNNILDTVITENDLSMLMAKIYLSNMLSNIKRAQEYNIKQGYLMHLAPVGYKNIRDASGRADVIIEPKVASIIEKLFMAYETELYTIKELTELAHAFGLKNKKGELVSKTCVNDILKNPFYAGLMRWKGKLYPHNYPTIIHKSSFDRVQEILKKCSHKNIL